MAILKALQVKNKVPVPSANAATDLIPIVGDYTITATDATGDIVEALPLPAGYVPVDFILDAEDLGATVTADVGIMSGAFESTGARTCGAEFIAAAALGTAGIYRMAVSGGGRIAPTTGDRSIGVKLSTVTTPTVGSKFRLTMLARPQSEGV